MIGFPQSQRGAQLRVGRSKRTVVAEKGKTRIVIFEFMRGVGEDQTSLLVVGLLISLVVVYSEC